MCAWKARGRAVHLRTGSARVPSCLTTCDCQTNETQFFGERLPCQVSRNFSTNVGLQGAAQVVADRDGMRDG